MTSPNKHDAVTGPNREQPEGRLLPCYPYMLTPKGKAPVQGDPQLCKSASRRLSLSSPAIKRERPSPDILNQKQGVAAGARKRSRRALNLEANPALFRDSGSEGESEEDKDRNVIDRDQECLPDDDVWKAFERRGRQRDEQTEWQESPRFDVTRDEKIENEREAKTEYPVSMDFSWSEDFKSFTGQKEKYTREPGPTFFSNNPTDIFCQIWDREFMEIIAKETNEYAWQLISQLSDPDFGTRSPKYLDKWTETTVEELYRYFAVLIYMSFCYRSKVHDYWDMGVMGMPSFRDIMPRNRFLLLNKFLHFVNNENLVSSGYDRKISKIKPLLDHCTKKFADLYTPSQHLSLDESLLLWKGRLSWKQCIRSKVARFGIKSFELCEAETGYLLQYKLYTGKDTAMHSEPLHGFNNKTAKVVLQLMERYLDAGHVLVMDNWYNQLPLSRYLKSRRTDVLGTLNRRHHHIPHAIRNLTSKDLKRGESVARHCGDIALVAWEDVKLVTLISTYHRHKMVLGTRAGQPFSKPVLVKDYNQYMGGVDLKDQKLSMFLFERKRNLKWYMKVFRRLFNTSLLNAFIIYLRNPMYKMCTHRQFRWTVAEGLLSRNLRESSVPSSVPNRAQGLARLNPGNHFPVHTDAVEGPRKMKHKQLRCVRCTAKKKRVLVTIRCKLCQVPLCIGKCWQDYHTLEKL